MRRGFKQFKRFLPFLVLSACLMIPTTARCDNTLVYSASNNVGPLNPHLYSPNQMFAQAMVYEPLVRYQEDGSVAPCLGESWAISADGRSVTFRLRQNVTFSDGTPFDAAAVKKNFDALLLNHQRHQWLELMNQFHAVKAAGGVPVTVLDHHVIQLTMKDPYYPILQDLSLIRPVRFLSPAAFPEDGDTSKGIKAPIGTGPWRLVKTVKGEYDLFERNDAYWGKKPAMERVLVKVIADANARAVAFDTGEIDLIYGSGGHGGGQLGLDTFQRYRQQGKVVSAISKPLATRALALNTRCFPTDDLAVRTAIVQAVNKAAIVEHIFLNVEVQADTLFAPNLPYCDLNLTPFAYDPAKAAAGLEQAGWILSPGAEYRARDGKQLALDLCFVGTDAIQKAVAEVIQGDLKKIGIQVNLIGEESDSFDTRQKNGEFGMIFGDTWGPPYDPHSFCSSMRVPSHADYQAQLGLPMKPELDANIGKVLTTVDQAARRALFAEILKTLHEQVVYLPLTYMTSIMVHRPELTGTQFGPTQNEIVFETIVKP